MSWLGPLQSNRLLGNQLANSFCLPIFLSDFNCSTGIKGWSTHLLPWILMLNLKSQSLACFFLILRQKESNYYFTFLLFLSFHLASPNLL